MRSPRREPWSFWCVLKCSVNWPMRSLSSAICTSGLPVSVACVRCVSITDCFCSLANTSLMCSCSLIDCLVTVRRISRSLTDGKGGRFECRQEEHIFQVACTVHDSQHEHLFLAGGPC